jgi:methionyl aminopeptidase
MERLKNTRNHEMLGGRMTVPHPSHAKAGQIAARVLREIRDEVKPGVTALRLCTIVERKILDYGGQPAFPCGVNINHIAAHHTSPRDDRTKVPDFGLVKIDIGVHVDGYIVDTAISIDLDGSLDGFVAATDDALQEAVQLLEPGKNLGEIGQCIEKVVRAYGLRPIDNLTGHSIDRYRVHGNKVVPNTKTRTSEVVEPGDCFAIEPYATTGTGKVVDTDLVYIFQNTGRDVTLEGTTEKLRTHLNDHYGPLPFALRWIGVTGDVDIVAEIRELLRVKAIKGYPVQVEKKGRPVSQSEHTIFISDAEPIVLTKRD